jgi:hypothetical protein
MAITLAVEVPGNEGRAAVTDATLNPLFLTGTNDLKIEVNLPLASVTVREGITAPSVQSTEKTTTIPAAGRPFTSTCTNHRFG